MSLLFTDYTSAALVRGLLGVAEEEIPDIVFDTMSGNFLLEIEETFEELSDAIVELFSSIKSTPDANRSDAQKRFYSIVQLYAGYIVADDIASGSVEMFSPIQITDGKAQQVRASDPYAALRLALKASLALWRARLGTALGALDATKTITVTKPTLMAGVGITIDPVTGV